MNNKRKQTKDHKKMHGCGLSHRTRPAPIFSTPFCLPCIYLGWALAMLV